MKLAREGTYYDSPPHIPSTEINMTTMNTLQPSQSSAICPVIDIPDSNIPFALSSKSTMSTHSWIIAGDQRNLYGRGGIPREMEEREKNTDVW